MHLGLLEIFAELCIYRGAWINGAPVRLLVPSLALSLPLLDLPLSITYSTEHFSCQHNQFLFSLDRIVLSRLLLEPEHILQLVFQLVQPERVAAVPKQ